MLLNLPHIAILVGSKGRGSNMGAIAQACQSGQIAAEVAVVIGPNGDAPALGLAASLGLKTATTGDILGALSECEIVCLAGYMRLLPTEVLDAFPGRVLNIHPSLLPKYGGKGMYGMHVHEAVLKNQDKESGCTVHRVTPVYDEGEIIVQMKCPVLPSDTPESLAQRVLVLEHQAYPLAIQKVLDER